MTHRTEPAEERGLRYREMISRHLGEAAMRAFADPNVTEIYVNADGRLRLDTRSAGSIVDATAVDSERVLRFLNTVASHLGFTLDEAHPQLQAELPAAEFRGARLQGFVPPLTGAPCFVIRKPPAILYSLDEYVAAGILGGHHRDLLGRAVREHANILVAGGTGSGKTTLANALLLEISTAFPAERILVLEDTVELQCPAEDTLALRTTGSLTLAELVKCSLRTKPDRIVIGEVRDAAALDLLDAWATGHPGGVATLHATDPVGALNRLDRLAQRANVPPQRTLIAEAINLVVMIQGGNAGRRVPQIVRVGGLDDRGEYRLEAA